MLKQQITPHFTFHEALWLPTWGREAKPTDGLTPAVVSNLKRIFAKLEQVRGIFNKPITIHCAYRPVEYNKLVKGAPNSAHLHGLAVDFDVKDYSCDIVKKLLEPRLEEFGIRMERNGTGADWVHLDLYPVGPSGQRYFIP
jgi:zinc D-Ala-D-Ala carboxypeptidase